MSHRPYWREEFNMEKLETREEELKWAADNRFMPTGLKNCSFPIALQYCVATQPVASVHS